MLRRKIGHFLRACGTYRRFGGMEELVYGATRLLAHKASEPVRALRWERYKRRFDGEPSVRLAGLEYILDPDDRGISAELAIDRTHEPLATARLMRQLRAGMTVVDVGSNLGYYAVMESRRVGDSGKVISIEPNPSAFTLLKKNLRLNGCTNVVTSCVAISDEEGTADLYLTDRTNVAGLRPRPSYRERVTVPVRRLDDLLRDEASVDVVRMDIEGHEVRALSGMLDVLTTRRPLLCIEFHFPQLSDDEISRFFTGLSAVDYDLDVFVFRWSDVMIFGRSWVNPRTAYKSVALDELARGVRSETVVAFFVPRGHPLDPGGSRARAGSPKRK